MSKFTKSIKVSPLSGGKNWVLLEPVEYYVGDKKNGEIIVAPKGLITDFASIPKPLHWWHGPWGAHGPAAIIHDWLYQCQGGNGDSTPYTREEVDKIFLDGMKVLGVPKFDRTMMYLAVKWFGWIAWKTHDSGYKLAKRMPERHSDTKEMLTDEYR